MPAVLCCAAVRCQVCWNPATAHGEEASFGAGCNSIPVKRQGPLPYSSSSSLNGLSWVLQGMCPPYRLCTHLGRFGVQGRRQGMLYIWCECSLVAVGWRVCFAQVCDRAITMPCGHSTRVCSSVVQQSHKKKGSSTPVLQMMF